MLVEGIHDLQASATRQDTRERRYGQRGVHRLLERVSRSRITVAPREARQSRQRELAKGAAFHWSRALDRDVKGSALG
jgi:hypothetical protein